MNSIYLCNCKKCKNGEIRLPDSFIDIISGSNKLTMIANKYAVCSNCGEVYTKGSVLWIKEVIPVNFNKYNVVNSVNTAVGNNVNVTNFVKDE